MSFARATSSFLRKVTASSASHRCLSTLNATSPLAKSQQIPTQETSLLNKCPSWTICSHAKLHTEGDRRFVELLREEIQQENERSLSLPGMSDGWKVSFNGAAGTLSKSHDGDKIEVNFSLNGSIPPLQDEDISDPEEDQGVASYPEFTVKVSKPGSSSVLEIECFFPDDVQDEVTDEESTNLFSMRSIIVYEGEVTEGTYIIETDNLDPNVYSYFLSYLADRSIDNQFAEEFIQLTTAAEQQEYVNSLERVKDFIGRK